MRAYWAILKDSFREAISSRVLQFLLGGIVLFLLLLSIPGLRVEPLAPISRTDIRDEREFVAELGRTVESTDPAELWVYQRLEAQTIAACKAWRGDRSAEHLETAMRQIVDDLNRMLDDEHLYDRDAWKNVSLNVETRQLLLKDWSQLSVDQQRRRNRQLLAGALSQLKPAVPSREYITYVFDEFEFTFSGASAEQVVRLIFYQIIKWMLGAVGVFLAILFTASIIPKMFEPGAIDLLMSKPVSRVGVFLAKFVGGCVFILMNGVVLVVGIFVILWLRYDIWNPKLLLAIPLQIFNFIIFFSISTYAGARWRNVILSVALTLFAWVCFWGVHQTWFWSKMFSLNAQHPEAIVSINSEVVVGQKNGTFLHWNPRDQEWHPFGKASNGGGPMGDLGVVYRWLGPVAIPGDASLVAVERMMSPHAQFFSTIGAVHKFDTQAAWNETTFGTAPQDIEELAVVNDSQLLFVTRSGLFEYLFEPPPHEMANLLSGSPNIKRLHAEKVLWSKPFAASVRPQGPILINSAGRLELWDSVNSGDYQRVTEYDTGDAQPSLVGLGTEAAIVARESGLIEFLAIPSLQEKSRLTITGKTPRQLIVAPQGDRAALLTQERTVHLFDLARGAELTATIQGQGEITAIAFTLQGDLLVGDRYPRVTRYSPELEIRETHESMSNYQKAFTYIINPLRVVLPQPDELDMLVQRLILDDKAEGAPGELVESLKQERGQPLDISTTLWSNGLFVIVMLTLSCLMIHYRDL